MNDLRFFRVHGFFSFSVYFAQKKSQKEFSPLLAFILRGRFSASPYVVAGLIEIAVESLFFFILFPEDFSTRFFWI
jgi:hypothetical protein